VLAGEQGPRADLVALNAGAAIYAAGKVDDLRAGVEAAREAIASGAAAKALEDFVAATRRLAPEPAPEGAG